MTAYILNLIDLFFTFHALSHGGVELNPIMAYCIDIGIFPYVKFLVGTGCCIWLEWQSKYHREAYVGKWVVTAYLMVLCINNIFVIGVINQ